MNELEMTLIGEILMKPEIMAECIAELSEQHFTDFSARRVYSECQKLFFKNDVIEPLTVLAQMGAEREDYKVYMANCAKLVISMNYEKHIQLIKEQAIKRMVASDCAELIENMPIMSLEQIQSNISEMCKYFDKLNRDDVFRIDRLSKMFYEYMLGEDKSIKTNLKTLDKTLMINKGDYIILGGRPSSGKTALSLQIAKEMSEQVNVVYFSLETEPLKMWIRMISNYGDEELRNIKNRAFPNSAEAWGKINQFTMQMSDRGAFTIVKAAGYTVSQIKAKAIQLKADVIFIDYLTLISNGHRNLNQYEQATQISKDLHTLAQTEEICVFALSQLNRESAKGEAPTMTDLRESGQIEQDADAILLLSNKTENEGDIHPRKLFIAKNKEGETGAISMDFVGSHQRFREVASRNL